MKQRCLASAFAEPALSIHSGCSRRWRDAEDDRMTQASAPMVQSALHGGDDDGQVFVQHKGPAAVDQGCKLCPGQLFRRGTKDPPATVRGEAVAVLPMLAGAMIICPTVHARRVIGSHTIASSGSGRFLILWQIHSAAATTTFTTRALSMIPYRAALKTRHRLPGHPVDAGRSAPRHRHCLHSIPLSK
jgi:hypothetical protein